MSTVQGVLERLEKRGVGLAAAAVRWQDAAASVQLDVREAPAQVSLLALAPLIAGLQGISRPAIVRLLVEIDGEFRRQSPDQKLISELQNRIRGVLAQGASKKDYEAQLADEQKNAEKKAA